MLVDAWVVVHDSQSVLVSSNVFVPEECSVSSHSRFDLEFDSVSQWISSVVKWSSVKEPSLVSSIVADVVDHLFVISVSSMENIEAVSSWVSEILSSSWEVRDLLVVFISPWSDDDLLLDSELSSVVVGKSIVSLGPGSDGLGS